MVEAITAKNAYSLLKEKSLYLIDIRKEQDFCLCYPDLQAVGKKVINVPYDNVNQEFERILNKVTGDNKLTRLMFMCYRGITSEQFAERAVELGYNKVYNLLGGFVGNRGWKESGMPIINRLH